MGAWFPPVPSDSGGRGNHVDPSSSIRSNGGIRNPVSSTVGFSTRVHREVGYILNNVEGFSSRVHREVRYTLSIMRVHREVRSTLSNVVGFSTRVHLTVSLPFQDPCRACRILSFTFQNSSRAYRAFSFAFQNSHRMSLQTS